MISMTWPLAFAEGGDPNASNLLIVVSGIGVLVAVLLLAIIPVVTAKRRKHQYREAIFALCVFWGVLTAGSIGRSLILQLDWSKEQTLRIESGYYDPKDQSDAPQPPWILFAAMAAAYGGIVVFSRRPPAPKPPRRAFEVKQEPNRE